MHTRGYIDGIFGAAVRGWVVDLDDPANVLQVVVHVDGQEFAAVAADEPRADLAKAGIGIGHGGFRVALGTPPSPGPHEIVAVIAGTAATVPLARDLRLLDSTDAPRTDIELYERRGVIPQAARTEAGPAGEPAALSGELVLAGEAGWLFACPARGVDLVRGVADPSRAALDRLVGVVERFEAAAAAQGVPCLVVVLPDKLHVYPEQAPPQMAVYPAGRIAEHMAARVQDHDDVVMLDLLATLLRARSHGRVFSRAGIGPTWIGAFHAYRAIAKHIALAVPSRRPAGAHALVLGPDEPVSDAPRGGVLARWQNGSLVPDGDAASLAATALEPSLGPELALDIDADGGAGVLIVHDAAADRIAQLLAMHGPTELILSDTPDPTDVLEHEPDVALWLVSDHTLAGLAGAR